MPIKYRPKSNFRKYSVLVVLAVMTAITLYFANYLIKKIPNYRAGAAAGNAQLFFEPESVTLPPNTLVNVWVTSDKPVAFVRAEFTFDASLLKLTQEITLTTPALKRIVKVSTMAEANSSGKVVLIMGLDPTTFSSAPTGSFKLAGLSLSPKVTTPNLSTSLTMITNNLQIVDTTATPFVLTSTPATLALNPVATATPTPTPLASAPVANVDTMTPIVSITYPSNGSTVPGNTKIDLAATASDNIGVTKVLFYVNGSLRCTDTAAPYICNWKTGRGNKTYTIEATAFDAAGNVGSSTVSVKNN